MQNNNFLLLKKFKNTESAQLCHKYLSGCELGMQVLGGRHASCISWVRTVPYEEENFTNSKIDNFSLIFKTS